MAKETKETVTGIDALNDNLTALEQKVEKNQKFIAWCCIGAAAIVGIVLVYIFFIHKPGVTAADNAIGQADITLSQGNDSLALVQYKQVADEYGHDAGNRAKLNAAILLYQKKQWQEAIEYLDGYKPSESIIGASSISLKGDCYVNLKNYDEALKCFAEAAKLADNNPAYTPYFLMKQATVLREQKKYAEEAGIYQTIVDEYPNYGPSINIDMKKYLERAKAQAGE